MRVLVCGHRSFAAKGLIDLLRAEGHDVTAFSRGPVGYRKATDDDAPTITGPVHLIHENPHLDSGFDTIVNYILLKDDKVEPNVRFVESLLKACQRSGAKHLVHISSISSYKASVQVVTEDAAIEEIPERKGSYGSLKVATDQYLLAHQPAGMKLSLVRPGFILGSGLINPIVGTAARLPWNKLLVIGSGHSIIPMTTRELVNQAVAKITAQPPTEAREIVVLAAPNSPTRTRFLQACCELLGAGTGVTRIPVPIWWAVAIGGELVSRLIGQGKLGVYSKLTARLPRQRFDASRSSARLGMDLSVDWEAGLRRSLDAQTPDFALPPAPPAINPASVPRQTVSFLGFGRIVRQKHLPAFKRLGVPCEIRGYDPRPELAADTGVTVEPLAGARIVPADLHVIASPGSAHTEAIDRLEGVGGRVMVEKPLCYSADELRQWLSFAGRREQGVYICHNYRFKQNVLRMLAHLRTFNPGRLDHVTLEFQSPPVSNDSVPWLRDERKARTLLMDYAIHFLDLACMFGDGRGWQIVDVRHTLNDLGQTRQIVGRLAGNRHTVDFILGQGFAPRRASIRYHFRNYSARLGFFPDTFVPHMADEGAGLHKIESKEARRQTLRKVLDKLTGRDSDRSHDLALAAALGASAGDTASAASLAPLSVQAMTPFYQMLFRVADEVYGGNEPVPETSLQLIANSPMDVQPA